MRHAMRILVYPRDPAPKYLELRVPDHWHDSVEKGALGLWRRNGEGALHLTFSPHVVQPGLVPYLSEQVKLLLANAPAEWGLGTVFGDEVMLLRVPKAHAQPLLDNIGTPAPDVVLLVTAQAIGNGRFHKMCYIVHQESVVMASFLCDEHLRTGALDEAMRILSSIEIR